jgi:flagellar protein FliS
MMTARKNQDAYKDTEILTANQGKLIVMLYEGAIRFLKVAANNMNPRTYDVANTNIIRAQDIVTELMVSLNMEEGGEVAQNLLNLYAYMKKRLLEGNIQKDSAIIEEVQHLLENLRDAWDQASRGPAPKAQAAGVREGASFSITG